MYGPPLTPLGRIGRSRRTMPVGIRQVVWVVRPMSWPWGALIPMLQDPDPCAVNPGCGVGAGRLLREAWAGGVGECGLLVLDLAALLPAALRGVLDLGRLGTKVG